MGRYPGRLLFMALPPEMAHHLALGLLALPLPWHKVGGRAPDDPSVHVELAGIPLANPIGLAAGFDKSCANLDHLGSLGFGYVVGGTITREPRKGHARPRIVRRKHELALVNAMGMPNDGAAATARNLSRSARATPRFASLADEDPIDVLAALESVTEHVEGLELNASSPNATWPHDAPRIVELLARMRERTTKPIFLKLPPFDEGQDRDAVLELAAAAAGRGASGFTCSNTRPVRDSGVSRGRGGLSGRPLFERTPGIVREVRAAVGRAHPINASGGIFTTDDVLACLEAGATTAQLYTSLVYEGPGIVGELVRGLVRELRSRGTDLAALVEASHGTV